MLHSTYLGGGGECAAFFHGCPVRGAGARAGVCENFYPEIRSVDGTHLKRYGKWPPGRIFFSTGRIIFEEWSFYGNLSIPRRGESVITKTEILRRIIFQEHWRILAVRTLKSVLFSVEGDAF